MCAPTTRFASKTGRVAATLHGQGIFLEDFVAEEICDRHFGRRNHVKIIDLRVVHLAFLIRQLPSRCRARRIDHQRRMDLRITCATGFFQEKLDEGAHQTGHVTDIKGEPGARHLNASFEVDRLVEPRNIPVRLGGRRNQLSLVAPSQDDLVVGFGAAFGYGFMRNIGDGQTGGLPAFFYLRDLLLQLFGFY